MMYRIRWRKLGIDGAQDFASHDEAARFLDQLQEGWEPVAALATADRQPGPGDYLDFCVAGHWLRAAAMDGYRRWESDSAKWVGFIPVVPESRPEGLVYCDEKGDGPKYHQPDDSDVCMRCGKLVGVATEPPRRTVGQR